MKDIDVLVIGGGISGLAVAHLVAQEGLSVEIWERESRAGGKIRTNHDDGYLTEQAASMVLNFRPEVNRFMQASGLESSKISRATTANRYLLDAGRLVALPMKLGPMMTSPLWSLRGKLRLAMEAFIPRGGGPQETVSEFITRRLGKEMLDKAMGPFVAGPLASDPDQANAFSVLPRLTGLEQRYGSLAMGVLVHRVLRRRTATVTEGFSFRGGMSTLVESLAVDPKIGFRGGYTVTELEPVRQGWKITGNARGIEQVCRARQVILSVPANVAARLTRPLDSTLAGLVDGIEYAPLCVVHTGFSRAAVSHPLDGNGFLVPRMARQSVNGCQWMSSLFADRAPPGKVLLSSYLGGALHPAAADLDDERSLAETLRTLQPMLGIKGTPDWVRIDRHPRALPLYHGAYHERMQAIDTHLQELPGLHLEANYRGGISIRDRIACAYQATQRILAVHRQSCPAESQPRGLAENSPEIKVFS